MTDRIGSITSDKSLAWWRGNPTIMHGEIFVGVYTDAMPPAYTAPYLGSRRFLCPPWETHAKPDYLLRIKMKPNKFL